MNKHNTVRSVKQSCWPLSVSSASLCHLKRFYPQTDVLSLTVCSTSCPFKGYEWNAKPQQWCPRPVIARVCATVIFWLRDGKCWESRALNLWERFGFALVGDTASVQSCRSFIPATALPVVSIPPRSWLGFVWQPALIAPWGILGGREPSPWWSEHRTSAKQSIVTGARWGERNKMSQQQVFFLFVVFAFNARRGLFSLWFICAAVC